MRTGSSSFATALVASILVAACAAPAPSSRSPVTSPAASAQSALPTPPVSVDASAPSASPVSTSTATLPVTGVDDPLNTIKIAPAPDGSLYITIGTKAGTVLARLDSAGRVSEGWPILLERWTYCTRPAAAGDGSVRVVCIDDEDEDNVAFAFDADGRGRSGWPVGLPGGLRVFDHREEPRVMDGTLTIVATEVILIPNSGGAPDHTEVRLVNVAAHGTVGTGAQVSTACCLGESRLSPDGIGYAMSQLEKNGSLTATITAFDMNGLRSGWPITIPGQASAPAFGPEDSAYIAIGLPGAGPTGLAVFDRDGRPLSSDADLMPIASSSEWYGAGELTGRPVVADEGTAFLIEAGDAMTVYAVDPTGRALPGWPYRSRTPMQNLGGCTGLDQGCGWFRSLPAVGQGPVLYLLLAPSSSSLGGSIVAIGRDGTVRPGWPVGLRRAGSVFSSVSIGHDGTVFAVAVERETNGRSVTVLGIEPDSSVRYRTTIVGH